MADFGFRETEALSLFSSNYECPPVLLTSFQGEIDVPALNISSVRLRFYAMPDLQLDMNCVLPLLRQLVMLWCYNHLQLPLNNSSERLEFFVATRDHLHHPNFVDSVGSTNATKIFMLPSTYQEFPHHHEEELEELIVCVSKYICTYEGDHRRRSLFKFVVYRVDDGTICQSEIDHIVSHDFLQSPNFPNYQRIMRCEGEIRVLIGTPNQLRHPMMVDLFRNFRRFVYEGQYRGNSRRMSNEEAAAVLGSSARWIERVEEGEEMDCAICLESIRAGEEVKVLVCEHVYHYECILISTIRKRECPLCRAAYG